MKSQGQHIIVILRHNPRVAITTGNIIRDAELTSDELRTLRSMGKIEQGARRVW